MAETQNYTNKSKVHDLISQLDGRLSAGFIDRLNEKIQLEVTQAAYRAKKNGRKTLMVYDL